ncbi:MAG: hypothetical protein D6800_06820 [Candidatus Zixiibacteriota bacterium]|nr:MAG: hypothetical protein D6800_06820 [candidate division Zixibacteria bacterium]
MNTIKKLALALVFLAAFSAFEARAQVVYLVGDDLPPLRVEEAIGPADTLTVLVDTSGVGHYMVHRADSIYYHVSGHDVAISRGTWEVIMGALADMVRVWEGLRRLGEQ